jgi:5'-3' exonuclease
MGVLKFQQWLRTKFREHVRTDLKALIGEKEVRRLLIDFNAIIHNEATEAYTSDDPDVLEAMKSAPQSFVLEEGGVVDLIMEELQDLIEIVKPKRLVYIAADGVVMKAKILQQRQRSFKTKTSDHPFNRNSVKPGTQFMITVCAEVRSRLARYAKDMEAITEVSEFPLEIEFSDDSEPGEGEHKIMTKLKERPKRRGSFDREVDVIYSPDSDMHFLSFLHASPSDEVVIMRHVHRRVHEKVDESLSQEDEDDEEEGDAKKEVEVEENEDIKEADSPYEFFYTSAILRALKKQGFADIRDFVFVCCFAGNDFVHPLPFVKYGDGNVFASIHHAYIKTFGRQRSYGTIYDGATVNWANVLKFLETLEGISDKFLENGGRMQILRSDKYYNPKTEEDRRAPFLSWAISEGVRAGRREAQSKVGKGKEQERGTKVGRKGEERKERMEVQFNPAFFNDKYRRFIFGTFHDPTEIRENLTYDLTNDMCKNYLEGLVWTMEYYANQGTGVNSDWSYVFHYSPTVFDLKRYVADHLEKPTWYDVPLSRLNSVINKPLEHLIAVLKQEDLYLVPDIVSMLFLKYMPHLFPTVVVTDSTMVPFGEEWRETVLVNIPDMASIRRLFSSIAEVEEVAKINARKSRVKVWMRRG